MTYLIAEIGVNHNGSPELAIELVDAMAKTGVDAVKFQAFKAGSLTTANAPKATYQRTLTDPRQTQAEMLRALELSDEDQLGLKAHTESRGLDFLSSPFDLESARTLVESLGVATIKIPSGEITNALLLDYLGRRQVDIILSTGMCTEEDVWTALRFLAWGARFPSAPESLRQVMGLEESDVLEYARSRVCLLHCTSAYPTPMNEVNLRAMGRLGEVFGTRVGFSDHTAGTVAATAAAALGAAVIEKHVTLDRGLPGPDHRASLEPDEMAELVRNVRLVEAALGNAEKQPVSAEMDTRDVARKSVVALTDIALGEILTLQNVGPKRPGTGLPATRFFDVLGHKAARDYRTDEFIDG